MRPTLESLQTEITAWPGMSSSPHRFGGVEFNLGAVEVGHIHPNGMADIPFNTKIRHCLVAEGLAEPHHLLQATGWITFYIRAEADVPAALRLFRLSYLFNAVRQRLPDLDIAPELDALNLSHDLRAAFESAAGIRRV